MSFEDSIKALELRYNTLSKMPDTDYEYKELMELENTITLAKRWIGLDESKKIKQEKCNCGTEEKIF